MNYVDMVSVIEDCWHDEIVICDKVIFDEHPLLKILRERKKIANDKLSQSEGVSNG